MRFFKQCPFKKCGAISGFDLPEDVIEKDRSYHCQDCMRDIKLSKWKESDKTYFVYQENRRKSEAGKELIDIENF